MLLRTIGVGCPYNFIPAYIRTPAATVLVEYTFGPSTKRSVNIGTLYLITMCCVYPMLQEPSLVPIYLTYP